MLLFTGYTLPIVAQSPIDCDGELTCPAPEPWRTKNAKFTLNGNCTISVTFRYTRCCVGCNYIIEILNMNAVNLYGEPCAETASSIVYYSIKLALVELYRAESDNMNPALNEVVVKTNSCYQYIPLPWGETQLNQCGPLCCVSKYSINKINNVLSVIGEISLSNGNQTQGCNVEVEGCQVACIGHQLTPTNINMDDYPVTDLCNLDCYWKLDGNNIVGNSNFIGPTNGQDFVVKTKNTENSTLMERIRVDNNRRIDFNLNSWYSMPQISFDANLTGTEAVDPTIKLYRPNGGIAVGDIFPAHPWWISVNNLNGENGWGAFNIWSANDGNTPLVGQETGMVKRLSILKNGNVGIGVEEPRQKVVVDGTICAREVRVSLSGEPCRWPDYDFNSNYKLRDLFELESYIQNNKHLPDIPTAADVTNSGIELGDMQVRMLKKIEELTLYIIELKKENEEIKKLVKSNKRGIK